MTPIATLYPLVLPYVRGASEVSALAELRQAAVEFCKYTRVWRDWVGPVAVVKGRPEVELDLPDGATFHEVREVWLGSVQLEPMSADGLRAANVAPTDSGNPLYYTHAGIDPLMLTLAPIPAQTIQRALRVRLSMIPRADATELPDALVNQFGAEIACGALARLHQHDAEWASPDRASFYGAKFQMHLDDARDKASRSNVRSRHRTRPVWF